MYVQIGSNETWEFPFFFPPFVVYAAEISSSRQITTSSSSRRGDLWMQTLLKMSSPQEKFLSHCSVRAKQNTKKMILVVVSGDAWKFFKVNFMLALGKNLKFTAPKSSQNHNHFSSLLPLIIIFLLHHCFARSFGSLNMMKSERLSCYCLSKVPPRNKHSLTLSSECDIRQENYPN